MLVGMAISECLNNISYFCQQNILNICSRSLLPLSIYKASLSDSLQILTVINSTCNYSKMMDSCIRSTEMWMSWCPCWPLSVLCCGYPETLPFLSLIPSRTMLVMMSNFSLLNKRQSTALIALFHPQADYYHIHVLRWSLYYSAASALSFWNGSSVLLQYHYF